MGRHAVPDDAAAERRRSRGRTGPTGRCWRRPRSGSRSTGAGHARTAASPPHRLDVVLDVVDRYDLGARGPRPWPGRSPRTGPVAVPRSDSLTMTPTRRPERGHPDQRPAPNRGDPRAGRRRPPPRRRAARPSRSRRGRRARRSAVKTREDLERVDPVEPLELRDPDVDDAGVPRPRRSTRLWTARASTIRARRPRRPAALRPRPRGGRPASRTITGQRRRRRPPAARRSARSAADSRRPFAQRCVADDEVPGEDRAHELGARRPPARAISRSSLHRRSGRDAGGRSRVQANERASIARRV